MRESQQSTPNLNDIKVFTRVVEAGGFTAAAKDLGMPTSAVSRRVARLEEALGVRLLQRTTRSVRTTESGQAYYQRTARAMEELAAAERAVEALQEEPRGLLRVTVPEDFGGRFWPIIDAFLEHYPKVRIDLELTGRMVDLVGEGFDVAIRGGMPPDSTLVGKKLRTHRRLLVASPRYLDRAGTPIAMDDLANHDCVLFAPWSGAGVGTGRGTWELCAGASGNRQVVVHGRIRANHLGLVKAAAVAGRGIAQLLDDQCETELRDGSLVEVLPGTCLTGGSIWVVYPSREHLSPAVRAFVEHLDETVDVSTVGRD